MTPELGAAAWAVALLAASMCTAAGVAKRFGFPRLFAEWECGLLFAATIACGWYVCFKYGLGSSARELPALAAAIVSAVTDLKTGYIFDRVVFAALGTVLVVAVAEGAAISAVIGWLVGAGVPYALHALTRGHGVGLGDVKLAGLLGIAQGPVGALHMLAIAAVLGGTVAAFLVAAGLRGRRDCVPFGPFLAAGGGIVAFMGIS